jgi:hypothetical protein
MISNYIAPAFLTSTGSDTVPHPMIPGCIALLKEAFHGPGRDARPRLAFPRRPSKTTITNADSWSKPCLDQHVPFQIPIPQAVHTVFEVV